MKPFVVKQHEKDFALQRELREQEFGLISGGKPCKQPTTTVTPNGDGGQDGSDAQ